MTENNVENSLAVLEEQAFPKSLPAKQVINVARPLLSGVIYGEIVFWAMLLSLLIAVPGFIMYVSGRGFLDSTNLLNHLWQGSDCYTIWQQVGNLSQPLPWYDSLKLLNNGDMLATLGIAGIGIAAVAGMWGAFFGMLRSKSILYIIFALVISVVLTLSALGFITF